MLPIDEHLDLFAPQCEVESFTAEEARILSPFFSSITSPVYVVHGLPQEVVAALASRYSRSKESLRRLFLKEYVGPIAYPEAQPTWTVLSAAEKKEAKKLAKKFQGWIDYLVTHGGIHEVVNAQRAQDFFGKWLAGYGDDSIAELGGAHVCLEGISNVAANIIEAQRIGVSPLEKSTRYVDFSDTWSDGRFKYVVPGELRGTREESMYRDAMDGLFQTYADLNQPYMEYCMQMYPQGADEDEGAFRRSRGAKRFDDLRDLLPFATQTNVGLHGNGRAFENMVHRLLSHPSGEVRWIGQSMCRELDKVVPSFVKRPQTERGAQVQNYRTLLAKARHDVARKALAHISDEQMLQIAKQYGDVLVGVDPMTTIESHVNLVDYTANGEKAVLRALVFAGDTEHSLESIDAVVDAMSDNERATYLKELVDVRLMNDANAPREAVRFRKPPREWEHATYTFSVWSRAGDYRDLHRHRMMTHERQAFTMRWGCMMESDVASSPFAQSVQDAYAHTFKAWKDIDAKHGSAVSEYMVPFAAMQNYSMHLTARALFWMSELRTGPQGRPEYRMLCQQMADQAAAVHPALFSALRVDRNSYSLARRESEIKASKRGVK